MSIIFKFPTLFYYRTFIIVLYYGSGDKYLSNDVKKSIYCLKFYGLNWILK